MKYLAPIICMLLAFPSLAWSEAKRADFTVAFQAVETDLTVITTSVMPLDTLVIRSRGEASAEPGHGTLVRSEHDWLWRSPAAPGFYTIRFTHDQQEISLQVFVLTPFRNADQDSLNGYRIGTYIEDSRGMLAYLPPRGFIELPESPAELAVSPSFRITQFLSKQQPDQDPTYLLLQPEMLIMLETLLEAANARGWSAPTLHVMSGFRTPFYNRSLGNETPTSRHLYGGAADVWIDGDQDGLMDDLNADGKVDIDDARALAALAESLAAAGGRNWPPGGIGIYNATAYHGPFIHIDARGFQARW